MLPVALAGTTDLWRGKTLRVRIAPPLDALPLGPIATRSRPTSMACERRCKMRCSAAGGATGREETMAMADASAMNQNRSEIVRAWHKAVNRGDADALVALCDDDIEVGGPRGSARGNAVLRDWLDRAGIQLEPRRWFASPTELVVEQVATWRRPDGGALHRRSSPPRSPSRMAW